MPLKRWTDFKPGDRVIASDCQRDAGTVLEVGPDATVAGRVHVRWDDGTPASWLRADLLKPAAPDFSALPDIDAGRMPVVQISTTNEAMADSRNVATYFDKRHADVLRDIRNLHCTADFRERNFAPFKINDLAGEGTSHVEMTKDGFVFLAMGFTGPKAALFKERYITAFNVMEAELRGRTMAPIHSLPQSFADALQLAANQARQIEQQQVAITTMTPKAEFVDRFVNSEGFYNFHDAAKALGCRPQYFCRWLRGRFCFAKGKLTPFSQFLDQGIFVTRSFTAENGHTGPQHFVTPKGIEFFSTRITDEIRIPNHQSAPALPAAATAH